MGKDAALHLIKEGHIVYGAARRVEQMKELEESGGHALKMDVTDEGQIVSGVKKILDKEGKIDVLVNNAGYGLYGAVEDISMEDARRQFDVNIFGLARITKEVLPQMRERKSGTIINISSMGGKMYTPLGAWYHATKHALEGWSDCLRLELSQFGINVVVVEPGAIATEFGNVMVDPMMKNSGSGPYADFVKKIVNTMKESYDKPGGSSPTSVITNIISKVIKSNRPKTRYRAGKWAKPMVWMRVYLGDRIFDKTLMSQFK